MLTKQAKMLSAEHISSVEAYLSTRHDPIRETTILYLSVYAGFRACEISGLQWDMLLDATGDIGNTIALTNAASKGKQGGRVVPIHPKLARLLRQLRDSYNVKPTRGSVITSRNNTVITPHAISKRFAEWYRACGLVGCSSHSGRRTFITHAARNISKHGGSLRDVQKLAGHSFLSTTERYIVENSSAQIAVIFNM